MSRIKKLPLLEFIILMALMTSILALSIDCMLPAFNDITAELKLNNSKDIQLIVSFIFLGLGIGKLFFGPFADGFGRRPVVFLGFGIYIVGCLISYFSQNLSIMLLGRVLQGFGVAGPANITLALVRDLYKGREMARIMSYIMAAFVMVPVIAPAIGLGILSISNWRTIFLVFLIISVLIMIWFFLRQEETLPIENRKKATFANFIATIIQVCKIKVTLLYSIIIGLTSGAFLGYLKTSQVIFEVQYGLGKMFPFYFASLAIAVGIASIVNGKIVRRFGMRLLSQSAMYTIIFCSSILIAISYPYSGHPPLYLLLSFLMINFFCMGILFGNLSSIAMEPIGHIAGMGAAVLGSFSTLLSVPIGIFIGYQYAGNIYSLMFGFGICNLLSIILIKLFDQQTTHNKLEQT